jgi:hypothetical protein
VGHLGRLRIVPRDRHAWFPCPCGSTSP